MRFLIDPAYYQELQQNKNHSADCYVRPGEYLHHMYVDGVKYVVAQALTECMTEAMQKNDADAIRHLRLHQEQLATLLQDAQKAGSLKGSRHLGDPPPPPEEPDTPIVTGTHFVPPTPETFEEIGLSMPFVFDMVLRALYNHNRLTGAELSHHLRIPFKVLQPILPMIRKQQLIDMVGQKSGGAVGDAAFEWEIKPPKGSLAVEDALKKTAYSGPTPVPFAEYVEAVKMQTIKNISVTRRTIHKAFADLIISPAVFNEIGPAINSAQSIFLFGYPGNGKTSVAERITRLCGDDIYIPYALEANGTIIKLYDPIVHDSVDESLNEPALSMYSMVNGPSFDRRWVRIKRPTIVVGGELLLSMLALNYNEAGKFYEAPVHMKANGGIFMIDDFGRQQVRPMDLLNRWIVPLEKKYDYLTTITGNKIEVPFDQLLIFSTNLDPNQLADEAFLRRIKFKIEIRDPDEGQWRQIWRLVCKGRKVEFDDKGIDYLVEKWYRPFNRPFRMCQPRDILDQMISIARYNMETVTFTPDLIDAGCTTYFVSQEKRDFGAKVRLE
jgi:hypothetical protein